MVMEKAPTCQEINEPYWASIVRSLWNMSTLSGDKQRQHKVDLKNSSKLDSQGKHQKKNFSKGLYQVESLDEIEFTLFQAWSKD